MRFRFLLLRLCLLLACLFPSDVRRCLLLAETSPLSGLLRLTGDPVLSVLLLSADILVPSGLLRLTVVPVPADGLRTRLCPLLSDIFLVGWFDSVRLIFSFSSMLHLLLEPIITIIVTYVIIYFDIFLII